MKKWMMMWMLAALVLACEPGTELSLPDNGDSPLLKMGKADWSMEGTEEHFSSAFNWVNDPEEFVPGMEKRLSALPTHGQASRVPWSDTYWPKNKGSISRRWNNEWMTRTVPRSADEARTWSPSELQSLSPSEKYDLYVGNYNYPLTVRVDSESSPMTPSWQGHCHGWTMASIHYSEPKPMTVVNPDGIQITFGSSDIKALLTYYQGDVAQSLWGQSILPFTRDVKVGGGACLSQSPKDTNCQDSNPGLFHITMANFLGLRKQAFGIDATTTREKWNHPVYRYHAEILGDRTPGPGAQEGAVREVIVRSHVSYVTEIEPRWDPVLATQHQATVDKVYTYTLELNSQGEIIGGQWILLLEDQTTPTFRQAWAYLTTVDEQGDGIPDHSEDHATTIMWSHFNFPDYVWFQERAPFADEFKQAGSAYVFVANSPGSRKDLFHYFARLKNLVSP